MRIPGRSLPEWLQLKDFTLAKFPLRAGRSVMWLPYTVTVIWDICRCLYGAVLLQLMPTTVRGRSILTCISTISMIIVVIHLISKNCDLSVLLFEYNKKRLPYVKKLPEKQGAYKSNVRDKGGYEYHQHTYRADELYHYIVKEL